MRRLGSAAARAAALLMVSGTIAHAQFDVPDAASAETRWGATVYGGGDVDSLANYQLGIRANYKMFRLPLARVSPELGIEVRKNYALFKIGGRGDSREVLRISGFAGGGVLSIRDFTNSGSGPTSGSETWFYYFGGKLRLPALGGVPILGRILGGLPLEGVSIFAGQEINGLDPPEQRDDLEEFRVDEWYTHSVQVGLMVGSASGFFE